MRAIVLDGQKLQLRDVPKPTPKFGEILLQVEACALCRTDLHIIDGDLPSPGVPRILGHQIVGKVVAHGPSANRFAIGTVVGVPWLGGACGKCDYCLNGAENLCDQAVFTGYQRDGGLAEYCTADERFAFCIPKGYNAKAAAPLLCAGMVGYRALKLAGPARKIGFYGFGSSAHLIAPLAIYRGQKLFAFTRPGDHETQKEALAMGAVWAGDSTKAPPELLDAAILFAPAGELVPLALKTVRKGGTVVCAEIHMSDIPSFPYKILWGERVLRSVANLTRQDGEELLALAPKVPLHLQGKTYPLEKTLEAFEEMRQGKSRVSPIILLS